MLRKEPLVTDHIYHIFNRGVNKGDIFFGDEDYKRFIRVAIYYLTNNRPFSHSNLTGKPVSDPVSELSRVLVLGYCLMSNHFHFLIKQLVDRGITKYIQHIGNSYSHYIHTKYQRVGPLFEGRFKNVLVGSDEQLVHLSRYIHLNPLVSGLVDDPKDYRWSSYSSYIDGLMDGLCKQELVLGYFKSKQDYERFVLDQADYARELERIKRLAIDLE
jgi:putative transposase